MPRRVPAPDRLHAAESTRRNGQLIAAAAAVASADQWTATRSRRRCRLVPPAPGRYVACIPLGAWPPTVATRLGRMRAGLHYWWTAYCRSRAPALPARSWRRAQVRNQATLKLYVIFNVLEIFDKLCASFGQDILDSLYASAGGRRRWRGGLALDFVIASVYTLLHTVVRARADPSSPARPGGLCSCPHGLSPRAHPCAGVTSLTLCRSGGAATPPRRPLAGALLSLRSAQHRTQLAQQHADHAAHLQQLCGAQVERVQALRAREPLPDCVRRCHSCRPIPRVHERGPCRGVVGERGRERGIGVACVHLWPASAHACVHTQNPMCAQLCRYR